MSAPADQATLAFSQLLTALRDSLPASVLLRLSESLPEEFRELLVRGWNGQDEIDAEASLVARVSALLPPDFPHHPCLVARAGLTVMADRLDTDVILEVAAALPVRTYRLWPPLIASRLEGASSVGRGEDIRIAS